MRTAEELEKKYRRALKLLAEISIQEHIFEAAWDSKELRRWMRKAHLLLEAERRIIPELKR